MENASIQISLFDWQQLKQEIADLQERVRELERDQQRRQDEQGYAQQGTRYPGLHPRQCACNRCLGIG
jgi:hypothetical protein